MHDWVYVISLGTAIALFPVVSTPAATPMNSRPTRLECLVGYPDGSFQGDRPLSRFEFAAGMAACLDQQMQQLGGPKGNFATREEVNTVLQTQQELSREIRQLQERVRLLAE